MNNYIPVIDLFAGPGGLSEGFSAFRDSDGNKIFKIVLSIEKETSAHKTLELRSFFREFKDHEVTEDYYDYLKGNISRDELFGRHPDQAARARDQAWHCELGSGNPSNEKIDQRIRRAINHKRIWVLIGGPPCQAYSIVGRSRRTKQNKSDFENDERHFLYKEYLRIVAVHNPPFFIMENVKGILSSKIEGKSIFEKILRDLKHPASAIFNDGKLEGKAQSCQYHIYSLVKSVRNDQDLQPADFIIKSENYGIPQKRHRVILLGIRSDYNIQPDILSLVPEQIFIEMAIRDLPKLRSGVSKEKDSNLLWKELLTDIPKCGWINDDIIDAHLRKEIVSQSLQINGQLNLGSSFLPIETTGGFDSQWFHDDNLKGICNHVARKHMRSDLHRYYFAACFAISNKKSPLLSDFPQAILPDHKNITTGKGNIFSDRFRVQLFNAPSTTITCHISKDGHYYIHPDPTQCRSLTVREAARLQTFPDNYFFEGNQTSQYQQVGNAVPPLLAKKIAELMYSMIP